MSFLGLYSDSLWMGLGGIGFFLILGWGLGKLNALIEKKVNLFGTFMAVPALIAAAGVACYVGYVAADACSGESLDTPGGKIFLLIFIPMALACAWRARSIAVVTGYVAVVVVGGGNVIWWIMGGN